LRSSNHSTEFWFISWAGAEHFINSKTFKLNYNVTVGPSGIKKMTLWRLADRCGPQDVVVFGPGDSSGGRQVWTKVLEQAGNELKPDKDARAALPSELTLDLHCRE
jgi:hypothetical protein